MSITLTPELEMQIVQKVKSGRFNSAGEVVREALRLMDEKEQAKEQRLKELRSEIIRAEKEFENGNYTKINSKQDMAALRERIVLGGRERLAHKQKTK